MKKDIVILVAVAVGSMAAGFALVVLLLAPGSSEDLPDPFASGTVEGKAAKAASGARGTATEGTPLSVAPPVRPEGHAQGKPAGGFDTPVATPPASPTGTAGASEQPAPANVPATPILPSGKLSLQAGEPFVWRCWPEGSDDHLEKEACGDLPGIEKTLQQNLGLVEQCVLEQAGQSASGKLSLALKVDFGSGKVNAWLGNSTTVAQVEDTSACIRTKFEGVQPPAIEHEHARYIVFFTITVG